MPKNKNIETVLIIGSGPIIIGQACEFDYSGTQASQSLREEGVKVILINDNPATIMTDPSTADKVYMLPLTPDSIVKILSENQIDSVLPTMGGQTALNLCRDCNELGIWREYGVNIIGVDLETIEITENRDRFRSLMHQIGVGVATSKAVDTFEDGMRVAEEIGFPLVIRPSFTLGGWGGGFASNMDQLELRLRAGLDASPTNQVLVEKAVLGWKEFELELLRDSNDNVVIICSIENFDPMGVHTGESITVAPSMTLPDTVYQRMRDMAIKMMRSLGKFAGGCNVQFALEPNTEEIIAVEINPRVSRSSALASKATGYPIAKIAAKLALGFNLDELKNPIVGTSAMFEPTLDYVVVKFPKWNFEKFPGADDTLGLQMRSVGESMAIGRTFNEALQKSIQGLEEGRIGLTSWKGDVTLEDISRPTRDRVFMVKKAFEMGFSLKQIHETTGIDGWFLKNIQNIIQLENDITKGLNKEILLSAKQEGFSDEHIGSLCDKTSNQIYEIRKQFGIVRSFKMVDTCSGEFPASTPYFYSTFERKSSLISDESNPTDNRKKVMILGSGPNRIGQGIEFDYACVHGVLGSKELGWETIMVNNNPETVSTDFNLADKLYFEPIYLENVLEIIEREKPFGVIVQLGGQTALKLSSDLNARGIKILGTSFDGMDIAEDRDRFYGVLEKNSIPYPKYSVIESTDQIENQSEFPVLVRPSYVIGGQKMKIIYSQSELKNYCEELLSFFPNNKIIIDQFIGDAIEAEADAICDGENVHIIGIMEHEDKAGVHSGDSVAYLPHKTLSPSHIQKIKNYCDVVSKELGIIGLINIQYVIKDDVVMVIEANPRSSRTVPFISKAYDIPFIKIATGVILGEKKLTDYQLIPRNLNGFAVKKPIFSTHKFGVEIELGPEMKSTGECIRWEPV